MDWFTMNNHIARIYVEEVSDRIDPTVVPVFPPDTDVNVGDVCSLTEGHLVRRGSVELAALNVSVRENPIAHHEFASAGGVSIAPSVTVANPLGGELAQTTITFSKARTVVASFQHGTERSVNDADVFGQVLMELWHAGRLNTQRVVVWSVRRVTGGTIIVSERRNSRVEVSADAALLGAAGLTLSGLSVGVAFGQGHTTAWNFSTPDIPLVTSVRLLALDNRRRRVVDGFRFESDPSAVPAEATGERPSAVTHLDLLDIMSETEKRENL